MNTQGLCLRRSPTQGATLSRGRMRVAWATALVLVGAWCAPAPAQTTEAAVPAPPAFCTQSVGRISDIQGDSFRFAAGEGRTVRIRLIDADCQPLGEATAQQAATVATNLLQDAPVWVFPVGQTKVGAADEIWADVWTAKGWLSQVLIRAGYAQKRTEPTPSSLSPADAAGTSNKGPAPAAPAFPAAACTPQSGDTLEIDQDGKKVNARLFEATCEGLSGTQRSDANATASRLFAKGGVWVFPCAPLRDARTFVPVRIWTAEGWLSDVLVKAGQAQRGETVEKPAEATAQTTPAPKPPPVKKPPEKPAEPAIDWLPISVTLAKHQRSSSAGARYSRAMRVGVGDIPAWDDTSANLESNLFKISSGVWRLTWETKAEKAHLTMTVYRCGGNSPDPASKAGSSQIATYSANTGSPILRTMPGSYWIRAFGAADVTVKVEEATPKKSE
ncbi:MAG: hypothetical protein IMZ44_06885 [Planctomycetes bacterium]|nr:hypothetical protein [Planctomycetota bacterium]